jgi:hypothetical protein
MTIRMIDATANKQSNVNAKRGAVSSQPSVEPVNEVNTADMVSMKQSVNTVDTVNAANADHALLARLAALEARYAAIEARLASLEAIAMPAPLPVVRKPASAERVAYMREYMRKRRAGA